MQRDSILSIDFFSLQFQMKVFLYLMDMHIDFQFILSSCGCISNKCMMVVGLPLPRWTKSFVPVLYLLSIYVVLQTVVWFCPLAPAQERAEACIKYDRK